MNNLSPVYYQPYAQPVMGLSPNGQQFQNKVRSEIKLQQAQLRVIFLQKTLSASDNNEPNKVMTPEQRNIVLAELADAQRELALLKQQFSPDKLKMMGY